MGRGHRAGVTGAGPLGSQALFLLHFSLHELITDSTSENKSLNLSDGYLACRQLGWKAQPLLHEAGHAPPTPQRMRCTLAQCGKRAAEAWFSSGHPAGALSAGWPHLIPAPAGRPVPWSLSSGTWSPPQGLPRLHLRPAEPCPGPLSQPCCLHPEGTLLECSPHTGREPGAPHLTGPAEGLEQSVWHQCPAWEAWEGNVLEKNRFLCTCPYL